MGQGDWWLSTPDSGVDHLGESSCSLFCFFKKNFLHIRPLEKNYSASSTYFPSCLKGPDFESLLLLLLTPFFSVLS